MFDIAWGEFILIAVVALIVIGPKELPAVLRTIGQWTVKIRRMAAEFQGQFQEALREAEMADLRKEVDSLNEQAKNFTSFDPVSFQAATKQEASSDGHGESAEGAKPHVEPTVAPPDAFPELAQAAAPFRGGADGGPGERAAASQPPIEPSPASEPPRVAASDAAPPPPSEGSDGKGGEGGVRP
jgi:sec-independent protein translocase protein TatB